MAFYLYVCYSPDHVHIVGKDKRTSIEDYATFRFEQSSNAGSKIRSMTEKLVGSCVFASSTDSHLNIRREYCFHRGTIYRCLLVPHSTFSSDSRHLCVFAVIIRLTVQVAAAYFLACDMA